MFSDYQLLVILFTVLILCLSLNIHSIINFLIYTEIIWIVLFNIFLITSVNSNLNIFTSMSILIIFLSTVELSVLIFILIKFSNLTKLLTSKNISNIIKKQFNKQYINKNLFWIYTKPNKQQKTKI